MSKIRILKDDKHYCEKTEPIRNVFFEDYIVESLNYQINDEKFLCLTKKDHQNTRYFYLPIKEKFFDNHSIKDLGTFEIYDCVTEEDIYVKWTFQDEIIYKKYVMGNPSVGEGVICRPQDFYCLTFLPFERPYQVNNEYNVGRIWLASTTGAQLSSENESLKERVRFFCDSDSGKTEVEKFAYNVTKNHQKQGAYFNNCLYEVKNPYDYIKINISEEKSVFVIPKTDQFVTNPTHREFDFSVDIGATNTHVAYAETGTLRAAGFQQEAPVPTPLSLDNLCVSLFSGEYFKKQNLSGMIDLEVLPDSETVFPHMTMLWKSSEANIRAGRELGAADDRYFEKTGWNFPWINFSLRDNSGATFGKHAETNFKWNPRHTGAMKKAAEGICYLIYAFIMKEHATLNNLIASYSVSMTSSDDLKLWWQTKAQNIFGLNQNHFYWISESEAPFWRLRYDRQYFIHGDDYNNPGYLHILVDIGGCSTDVAFVNQTRFFKMTSFRFAGNDIFGNGRTGTINNCLFYFLEKFYEILDRDEVKQANKHLRLEEKIDYVHLLQKHMKDSSYIHQYLFSKFSPIDIIYPSNGAVQIYRYDYSEEILKNRYFRLVFYYFYAAIICHICENLKKLAEQYQNQNYRFLRNIKTIVFTGNGSKLLKILKDMLGIRVEEFTKKLFKVFLKDNKVNIRTERFLDNPKALTAEGGLYFVANAGNNPVPRNEENDRICENENKTLQDLMEDDETSRCLQRVKAFNDLFINFLTTEKDFMKYLLGIGTIAQENEMYENLANVFRKFLTPEDEESQESLENQLQANYLSELNDMLQEGTTLKETTFFFPLKYIITEQLLKGFPNTYDELPEDKESILEDWEYYRIQN